ncbi:hypothetical protein [Patulibacter minatonensis]|uniref:hypothetical protein n=1 Tax=Patulibacter minatonensis TaxID=298163 RepID=UPI00047D44BB|nr:hypothetical protein [Patulibacter minatonensis]
MFTPVKIVRFWLPALIFAVGLAMVVISPDIIGLEGAALMLGGGLGVVVSNKIHRMGLRGERDRDDELGARTFMQKYGVWPDEASEDLLDEAERAGDILPRGPLPGSVAAGPAPIGPAPAHAASATSAPATPSPAAREDPHAPRKPAPEPGAHPHSGARRAGRPGSRRPRRR